MRRFFRELARRRLSRLPLDVIFVVDRGKAAVTVRELEIRDATMVSLAWPAEDEVVDVAELARTAQELGARFEASLSGAETHLPRLIYCCLQSGQIQQAQRWRAMALAIYNHFGLYEDALFFGEPLLEDLDRTCVDSRFSRWLVVSGLFNALVAVGKAERAYQIVHDEALQKIADPKDLISIYYTLAMLHCRFLPNRDLGKAEDYLTKSLEAIEQADLDESEKHYLAVFSLNGLAFIRHLQGRVAEALELCRSGFERLKAHLRDDQYRLHRSVLLYNIAQVHTSTRSFDEAIAHYTAAMEIDPRYSEYYNERGSVFLKMGRLDAAVADYQRAIELSAPYYEVWTNLGQAYKLSGDLDKAVAAYSTALDLNPLQVLSLLGRAQALEMSGRPEAALADYSAALAIDASNASAWSNRAVLHYEMGRFADAGSDLDEAIRRAPAEPDLYCNRAVALTALGRLADAARDHEKYLSLLPGAPDRGSLISTST
jgi:tetratricopeptide (TPR) repeat protein